MSKRERERVTARVSKRERETIFDEVRQRRFQTVLMLLNTHPRNFVFYFFQNRSVSRWTKSSVAKSVKKYRVIAVQELLNKRFAVCVQLWFKFYVLRYSEGTTYSEGQRQCGT